MQLDLADLRVRGAALLAVAAVGFSVFLVYEAWRMPRLVVRGAAGAPPPAMAGDAAHGSAAAVVDWSVFQSGPARVPVDGGELSRRFRLAGDAEAGLAAGKTGPDAGSDGSQAHAQTGAQQGRGFQQAARVGIQEQQEDRDDQGKDG